MNFHDVYYQMGEGGRGVNNVFIGAPHMRGHGLGSWFSGIFRRALPFLAKGARAVGKEALRAGANILGDIGENNISFKESFKNRANESGRNLKRKAEEKIHKMMHGSGYKALAFKKRAQSRRRRVTRRITTTALRKSRLKSKKRRTHRQKKKTKRKSKTIKSVRKRAKKKKNTKRRQSLTKKRDIFD